MNESNASPSRIIVIDGSKGEGGGQILRNAIAYAVIFRVPLKVHSIRAGRSTPGLRAQHATGLNLARDICGGTLKGAEVGSDCIEYEPPIEPILPQEGCDELSISAAIGTAGSICLLLQVGFPCALLLQSRLTCAVSMRLEGGTNAALAPQLDYFEEVFLPTITQHAIKEEQNIDICSDIVSLNVEKRGYYPIGGGIVNIRVSQWFQRTCKPLHPIVLMERGILRSIHIKSFYGGRAHSSIPQKMANAALEHILQNCSILEELTNVIPTVEVVKHQQARGSGTGIIIIAKTSTNCIFGSSALGDRKSKPQLAGEKAAKELIDALVSGGCVDDWLSDQLILFMALAKGESKILTGGLTLHTRSAIQVATEMTSAEFNIQKIEASKLEESSEENYGSHGRINGKHIISCKGVGFSTEFSSKHT